METVKLAFVLGIMVLLIGLLANALLTGSVWVKGSRRGAINYRELAHKRERSDEPFTYWFAVTFYALALLALTWLLRVG